MLDLHVHLLGHRDRKATKENIRCFLEEAKRKKLVQIGFADHDDYWEDLKLNLIREVAEEYPELKVRVGLEVDFREGIEEKIQTMKDAYPFDYIIGSVHQIGDWFFDFPEEEEEHFKRESDNIYREYFSLVEKASASRLFNIIGHFDLIKLFKLRPKTDVRILAESALKAVKKNGLVLEINTNGRYKPVNEFYPEDKLIEMIKKMEIPFTLASDAHEPGVVGRDLLEVCELLRTIGIKEIIGFAKGKQERFLLL